MDIVSNRSPKYRRIVSDRHLAVIIQNIVVPAQLSNEDTVSLQCFDPLIWEPAGLRSRAFLAHMAASLFISCSKVRTQTGRAGRINLHNLRCTVSYTFSRGLPVLAFRRPRISLSISAVVKCLSFSNPGIITIAVVKRMLTASMIAH